MERFVLHSDYAPAGDQPQAIDKLVQGLEEGKKEQRAFPLAEHGDSGRDL